MKFRKERIGKIIHVLDDLMLHDSQKITDIKWSEGKDKDGKLENFVVGARWGGVDKHFRFLTKFETPKEFVGQRIALKILTGQEKEWDAINPQFLLHCNGKLMQGIDVNHNLVILTEEGKAGETHELDFVAHSGMVGNLLEFKLECSILDKEIERLYYNLRAAHEAACQFTEDHMHFINTMNYLTDAVNMLDLREQFTKEFYNSVEKANKFLEEEFYDKFCGKETVVAKCIGHTHIDVAWLWTTKQTEEKVERSFATVMTLLDQFPEYKFMSSQPLLYKYIKQNNKELYEKIKEKVKEGRWEVEGAMWVEPDCNISSGESLVRQIIFGKRFFKEEFNKDNKVLWLPDVFGYSAALPQILKKTGTDYFITSKISWNEFNRMPCDTFMWRGIDGTEVLTQFITIRPNENNDNLQYYCTYNGKLCPPEIKGGWDQYLQKNLNNEIIAPIGYGDGGGGTTRYDLQMFKRLAKGLPGVPKTEFGTVRQYMEDLDERVKNNERLPRWVGELYLEYHRGTYTSMALNKKYNRKMEILAQDTEFLWSLASIVSGEVYPHQAINEMWESILLNQFHDILPGSSIKQVYEDSREVYEVVEENGNRLSHQAIDIISKKVKTDKDGVIVWNGTSFNRNDYISHKGKKYFVEDIPSKGYKFVADGNLDGKNTIKVEGKKISTPFYEVEFDENYNFASIFDKENNREVLKGKGNLLQAFEDMPIQYDAWDINIYYQEKMWEVNDVSEMEILDLGGAIGVRVKRSFLNSKIEQTIIFYEKMRRIDFETTIDWKEKDILLKTCFPVDILANKATYDIQYGNIERPNHWNTSWDKAKFEVCAHKWADLSQGEYGVSLLNDCKYGYDIKDNVMRLTLLKSATYPNPEADKCVHNFTYSILPHSGDWKTANTPRVAYFLNMPMGVSKADANPSGTLEASISSFNLVSPCENVIIEVQKQADCGDMLILRLYECYNRNDKVKLNSFKNIESAWECSMLEEKIGEMEVVNGILEFEMKPYEIKTIGLKLN